MKNVRRVLAGALIVGLVAGCGGSGETVESTETVKRQAGAPPLPPEIRVTLDGHMGPQNVGLLLAERRGYFEDAGLDVWLGAPVRPRSPVPYVANRQDELGIAQLPQVALARDKGVPVEAVGSVIRQPTAAMIWLEGSGIRDVSDLRGKSIGIPGVPFQEDFLASVLERAGLAPGDVEIRPIGYGLVPALLHEKVDAIFGGSWNLEGAALESRGAKPVVRRVESLGIPAYEELVVIARSDRVAADPQMIRAFMAAVQRGTVTAVKNPRAAAKAIEESSEVDPGLTLEEAEAQLKATLPLLSRSGRMDPRRAAGLVEWMQKQGQLESQMSASALFTNEYLTQPPSGQ